MIPAETLSILPDSSPVCLRFITHPPLDYRGWLGRQMESFFRLTRKNLGKTTDEKTMEMMTYDRRTWI